MTSLDTSIIGTTAVALLVFIVGHVIVVRFSADDKIFDAIQKEFLLGFCVLTLLVLPQQITLADKFLIFILSLCMYGLASFFYVLCLFGPYATSIRMRLVKELDDPKGKTLAAFSQAYNDHHILGVRLKRLLSAGDVRLKGDQYVMARDKNAFFIIDAIAEKLHALIRSR